MWLKIKGIPFLFLLFLSMVIFSLSPAYAFEMRWENSIDNNMWEFKGDNKKCSLKSEIADFGSVEILNRAGETLQFVFSSHHLKSFNHKLSNIETRSPFWLEAGTLPSYYQADPYYDSLGDRLFFEQADVLFENMIRGAWINLNLSHDDGSFGEVIIKNVNFSEPAQQFSQCRGGLLAMNYEQVRDTTFFFENGQTSLSPQAIFNLKSIAKYIAADSSVKKVLVDGHSDLSGSFGIKMRVSRERAEEVAAMLVELGVSKKHIQIRGHADRTPIYTGQDSAEQTKNRRVTVRLVRDPKVSAL